MKYVGAHLSISGGVWNAPDNAAAIGATGFAMFTKNQRQWVAKPQRDYFSYKKMAQEEIPRYKLHRHKH